MNSDPPPSSFGDRAQPPLDRDAHIKQILLAIRNVNQLIVTETDPQRLIERACIMLTETLGYHNAWIALLNPVDQHLQRQAESGFGDGFKTLRACLEHGDYPSCMAAALAEDRVITIENPPEDCPDCPLARQYAGRSGLAHRLAHRERTYGVLIVSVPAEYAQDDEEQMLFREVAGDLGLALFKIEALAKQQETEAERETTLQLLQALSRANNQHELIREITTIMRNWSECQAVGVRLCEGEDYPYYETRGFPEEFVEAERHLCALDEQGQVVRDGCGSPVLECMCGNVIRGRVDPTLPFFTEYGSFWTNSTTDLLASTGEADRQGRTRNRCHGEGYESVALIPLRHGDETLGLLQFNDRRRGMFDEWRIQRLERLAANLSIGLAQRQAAEALRESEERFSALVQSSPVAILTLREGRYVFANPAAVRLLGFESAEAMIGQNAMNSIAPEYRERIGDRMKRVAAGEGNPPVEMQVLRADGRRAWAQSISVPITIDGQPMALVMGQDITERKRAEQELARSEREKSLILNSTTEMFAYYDLDLRIQWANRAAGLSVGKTAEELVGLHCYRIWHGRDEPCEQCPILKARESKTPHEAEVQTPDGREWLLRGYPVLDESGEVTALIEFGQDITERKRAERSTRQERDRAQRYLDIAGAILLTLDTNGRVSLINQKGCEVLGCPREEILGADWFQSFIPEDAREEVRRIFSQIMAGRLEPHEHIEGRIINRTGRERWINWHNTILTDDQDRIVGTLSSGQDITDRRQAEADLREAMLRQQEAVAAGRVGLWDWNLKTNRVSYSREWKAQIGYEEDEISDEFEEWRSRVHPDDLPGTLQHINQMIEERARNLQTEFRFRHKDGTYRWILTQGSVLTDPSGTPARMMGSHIDITEQKLAEGERARLASAVEQTTEVVVITDADARIQYVNPAFEKVTGYTRREVIGRNPRILQSGEHDPAFYRQLWGTLLEGRSWYGRMVNRKKDGTHYIEEAVISPVHDAAGTLINYVAVKRDVTEETAREKQLLHSQKMEAVGRLAAGVAHDFNNALQVILGYAELLSDRLPHDTQTRQFTEAIMTCARHTHGVAKRLLAFTRQQPTNMRPVNIRTLLLDIETMLRGTIGEDIALHISGHDEPIMIRADSTQIEQVLVNLCLNARQAMPQGGRVTIHASRARIHPDHAAAYDLKRGGDCLVLTVTDTGCGMDEQTLSHVFEPFYTTREEGSGLGLATCYGIVKQHGGSIRIDSEPGRGTIVTLLLPSVSMDADMAETESPETGEVIAKGKTVLIAEDETLVRDFLRTILEGIGLRVLLAKDGNEAMAIGKEHLDELDLAILDVVMPGRRGSAVCRELRRARPDLPVILISGYATEADLPDADEAFREIPLIHKPFAPAELLELMRQAMR